jgi:Tol biopolymer transport system component
MKFIKRTAYLLSTLVFSAASLLAYAPPVSANSYPGGNWKLTFYSPVDDENTAQEIYVVNADGSGLVRITDDDIQQANPQWSPNMTNRQIAFDQDTDVADPDQDRNIYIQNINANGEAVGAPTELNGADTTENEWDPSWSPDGSTIAFHRRSTVGGSGPNHIFTIDSSGGTAEARTGGGVSDDDYRDTEPTWNKDGDTLVFTRTDTSDDSTIIATVPSDGVEADVVTIPGSEGGGSPQWSPLTNTIVFQKDGEIWTYTIGDASAEQLTTGADIPFAPTYSPDGTIIAASGNAGIAYYNANTGAEITTVTIATNAGLGFDASNGIHEVDWARRTAPDDTVHECTTYVNTDCTEFEPEIPEPCAGSDTSEITTAAEHGTPKFSNGTYTFTPAKDYVGEDQYVYTYLDENWNSITCTVNITVLPKAPDTGAPSDNRGILIGSILATGALSSGYIYKKKRFARR